MDTRRLDVVVCAGPSDVGDLLPSCLELLFANFELLGQVHVVTPQVSAVEPALRRLSSADRSRVSVWADDVVCPEASTLHPWFRQQYIKLHADRLTTRKYVACLGADTLLIRTVGAVHLFDSGSRPLLRFFRYGRPNRHLWFERSRVVKVAEMLRVEPRISFLLGDFICDLFVFDTVLLRALRTRLGGSDELQRLLCRMGPRHGWDNRFGEWTLYAVFALDCWETSPTLVRSTPGYFQQIHSEHDLHLPERYDARLVHFAWRPDRDSLATELALVRSAADNASPAQA